MKLVFILTAVLLFSNLVLGAGSKKKNKLYKAPVFKRSSISNSEVKFVKNWDDNSGYKFKDTPEKERALASSPDEEKVKPQDIQQKRDPSSVNNNKEFKVRGWDLLPTLDP